jgi:uncharacterized protein (DUF983 family)
VPKRRRLIAFLQGRCPICKQGKIFLFPWYNYRRFAVVYQECPVCGCCHEPETGFYFGAMYFSYALAAGSGAVGGILLVSAGYDVNMVTLTIPLLIAFMLPIALRASRLLMLYWIKPAMYKSIVQREKENWKRQSASAA